jgi:hypothetical protein
MLHAVEEASEPASLNAESSLSRVWIKVEVCFIARDVSER